MADIRAALADPAQVDPAPSHGPWCVKDNDGDSAAPFVHDENCRRDDAPSDAPQDRVDPAPEMPGQVTGRDVHAAWRDGMLAQGRYVAPERMSWETLTEQDRELDDGIAARIAAAPELPGQAERP